jgi:hypothetical protein
MHGSLPRIKNDAERAATASYSLKTQPFSMVSTAIGRRGEAQKVRKRQSE